MTIVEIQIRTRDGAWHRGGTADCLSEWQDMAEIWNEHNEESPTSPNFANKVIVLPDEQYEENSHTAANLDFEHAIHVRHGKQVKSVEEVLALLDETVKPKAPVKKFGDFPVVGGMPPISDEPCRIGDSPQFDKVGVGADPPKLKSPPLYVEKTPLLHVGEKSALAEVLKHMPPEGEIMVPPVKETRGEVESLEAALARADARSLGLTGELAEEKAKREAAEEALENRGVMIGSANEAYRKQETILKDVQFALEQVRVENRNQKLEAGKPSEDLKQAHANVEMMRLQLNGSADLLKEAKEASAQLKHQVTKQAEEILEIGVRAERATARAGAFKEIIECVTMAMRP